MSRWAQQLLALVETQSPFQPVKRGCRIDEVKRRWLAAVFLKTGADVFLVRVLLTTDGHQMLTRIDTLLLGIPGFEKTCCLAGAAANLKNSGTSLDGCMKQNPVSILSLDSRAYSAGTPAQRYRRYLQDRSDPAWCRY